MEPTSPNFQKRKREVDRMVDNWTTLLDNMLEMVILIKDDNTIEFMNRSAISAAKSPDKTGRCHERRWARRCLYCGEFNPFIASMANWLIGQQ